MFFWFVFLLFVFVGKMVEFDELKKLLEDFSFLFVKFVVEYWVNIYYWGKSFVGIDFIIYNKFVDILDWIVVILLKIIMLFLWIDLRVFKLFKIYFLYMFLFWFG